MLSSALAFLGSEIGKVLKVGVFVGLIVGGLVYLGNTMSNIINYNYLTTFFSLIRRLILPFDFFIDTNTLFTIFGIALMVQVGIWGVRGYLFISRWFVEK